MAKVYSHVYDLSFFQDDVSQPFNSWYYTFAWWLQAGTVGDHGDFKGFHHLGFPETKEDSVWNPGERNPGAFKLTDPQVFFSVQRNIEIYGSWSWKQRQNVRFTLFFFLLKHRFRGVEDNMGFIPSLSAMKLTTEAAKPKILCVFNWQTIGDDYLCQNNSSSAITLFTVSVLPVPSEESGSNLKSRNKTCDYRHNLCILLVELPFFVTERPFQKQTNKMAMGQIHQHSNRKK